MSRLQSKRFGRKPPVLRIKPKELRQAAEDALIKRGSPSKRWGSEQKKVQSDQ